MSDSSSSSSKNTSKKSKDKSKDKSKKCNCPCVICKCKLDQHKQEIKQLSLGSLKSGDDGKRNDKKSSTPNVEAELDLDLGIKNKEIASRNTGGINVANKEDTKNLVIEDENVIKFIKKKNSEENFENISDSNGSGQLTKFVENSQTNSGIIGRNAQFSDGGFGDIGMQWNRVGLVNSKIVNTHISLNINLTPDELQDTVGSLTKLAEARSNVSSSSNQKVNNPTN